MEKVKNFLIHVGMLLVALPVLAFIFIYEMCLMLFGKGGTLPLGDEPFDIYPKGHPLWRL